MTRYLIGAGLFRERLRNDLSISPYFDEEDGIMYYIGVQKDVSELVTLQEEITTLRNQLAS